MTEIKDLATAIANTKEELRQAIVSHGVSCDTSVKFSEYPSKVRQVQRDPAFYCRNDLGKTSVADGEKVLIQELEQQGGLEVKFFNSLQKQNWGSLVLYPSSQTKFLCDSAYYYGGCGLYSWTAEDGLQEIYAIAEGKDDYGTTPYRYINDMLSPSMVEYISANSNLYSYYQKIHTPDGTISSTDGYDYWLQNGYAVKHANNGDWTLWTYNTQTGEHLSQLGQCVTGQAISYRTRIYVTPNGKYIIYTGDNGRVFENVGGAISQKMEYVYNLTSIVNAHNYHHIIGGTADGKYMIVDRYSSNSDGERHYPAIIEMSADCTEFSEYTDLAITGTPTWYPWLSTLVVKNASNVVRMFNYANGTWTEVALDFPDTFTANMDGRVTLNYDGSMICVCDAASYNNGSVYVYRLTVDAANKYKAVPLSPHNFNTRCYTALCTGSADDGRVQVNALLPTLPSNY